MSIALGGRQCSDKTARWAILCILLLILAQWGAFNKELTRGYKSIHAMSRSK